MTGKELKVWRIMAGLSQKKLADMLGFSVWFINKYEKLPDDPIPKKLLLLIEASKINQ